MLPNAARWSVGCGLGSPLPEILRGGAVPPGARARPQHVDAPGAVWRDEQERHSRTHVVAPSLPNKGVQLTGNSVRSCLAPAVPSS